MKESLDDICSDGPQHVGQRDQREAVAAMHQVRVKRCRAHSRTVISAMTSTGTSSSVRNPENSSEMPVSPASIRIAVAGYVMSTPGSGRARSNVPSDTAAARDPAWKISAWVPGSTTRPG